MKTALKTDKTYLTNDEILARVEQSSLDEFVKYIESQPKMTKADYNKAFKRFVGCLGVTAAGYFVLNGDFKN